MGTKSAAAEKGEEMKNTVELMAQHHMKVEYAYDISSDAAWVRATAPNGIMVSVKETPAGLAVDTQLCVERLAEALK